jgi:hypothetical protein
MAIRSDGVAEGRVLSLEPEADLIVATFSGILGESLGGEGIVGRG